MEECTMEVERVKCRLRAWKETCDDFKNQDHMQNKIGGRNPAYLIQKSENIAAYISYFMPHHT